MRILIIDDSDIHLNAAKEQLKHHEVTVVNSYDAGRKLVASSHNFEAVLVDFFMPASGRAQGGDGLKFAGKEMPIGIFLALLAANNCAKYVAVVTATGHHDHPASACLDDFNEAPFSVGEAKIILLNDYYWVKDDVKRWDWALNRLVGK